MAISLLAGVAGAHQLGTLQPAQLQHLLAQLARLYDEFADAIASGSEFALRRARERFEKALTLVDRASEALGAIMVQAEEPARRGWSAWRESWAWRRVCWPWPASSTVRCSRPTASASRSAPPASPPRTRALAAAPADLAALLDGLWERPVHLVLVSQHELSGRPRRVRARAAGGASLALCPPAWPRCRASGVMELPPEMAQMRALLDTWRAAGELQQDLAPAVLGGSYARSAYQAAAAPAGRQAGAALGRHGRHGAPALAGALVGRAGRSE